MDGGGGTVVPEAVVVADDAEASDAADIIEDIEALGASGCQ